MSDTDIKMSDVFDLPISSLMRDSLGNDLDKPDIGEGRAIAHAINSYDALVERNKALNEVINEIRAIVTYVQDGFGITGGDAEILNVINDYWSKQNEN